jgi:hypothetical protein
MMRTGKFVVLVLVLLGVIAGVLIWQLGTPRTLTYTQAVSKLDSLLKRVSWSESTGIGALPAEKQEVLQQFAQFAS